MVAGADPSAAVGVLGMWAVVHLRMPAARPRAGVPDLAALTRYVAVPFAFIALAVAVGMVPETSLAPALVTTVASSVALWLTAATLSGRRRATRVLVVGDRQGIGRAAVGWTKRADLTVVGAALVDDRPEKDQSLEMFGLPTGRGVDDLAERVTRLRADAVVVLPSPAIDASALRRMSWALEGTDATLAIKTELQNVSSHRLAVSRIGDFTVAEVAPSRAPVHVRAAKALIDRVGGMLLLVLLSPVLVSMIVAVRLESRGRGLFTQTRVGQNGRLFKVYKMRTMCADAEERKQELERGATRAMACCSRCATTPGSPGSVALLRKTSLDELPQLLNVVKGEMSLVGPRPAPPQEVAALRRDGPPATGGQAGHDRPVAGQWSVGPRLGHHGRSRRHLHGQRDHRQGPSDLPADGQGGHQWQGCLLMGRPVLMVSTQGGHLTQLLVLKSWWGERERLWVCPNTPDVVDRLQGERVVTSYSPTTRNLRNTVRNLWLALRVIRRERPQLVVSAGAGVAVPFFVVAWLMRIPTVFIEVYDRVDSPTMTGRLCGPFTTRRIVQWEDQLSFYPDARLVGPLL